MTIIDFISNEKDLPSTKNFVHEKKTNESICTPQTRLNINYKKKADKQIIDYIIRDTSARTFTYPYKRNKKKDLLWKMKRKKKLR